MIAVGKELLIGRTLNTNAQWVGRRLAGIGTMIHELTTVDDQLGEIASALRGSLDRRPDFVVVCGGLGPTHDDMTLRGVADGLGLRLKTSRIALLMIREHYSGRGLKGIEMTGSRRKMALFPEGATPVRNPKGTAPGARITRGTTVIFCLPGVPLEMREMFAESVEPAVRESVGRVHRSSATIRLEGIFESTLAPILAREVGRHPRAYVKSHPRGVREGVSRIELDIAVTGPSKENTEREVREVASAILRAAAAEGGTVKSARGRAIRGV